MWCDLIVFPLGALAMPDPPARWLSASRWQQCVHVSSQLKPFALLCESLLANAPQWDAFKSSADVYGLISTRFSENAGTSEETTESSEDSKREYSVSQSHIECVCVCVYADVQCINVTVISCERTEVLLCCKYTCVTQGHPTYLVRWIL